MSEKSIEDLSENPFDLKALDDGLIWYRVHLRPAPEEIQPRVKKLLSMGCPGRGCPHAYHEIIEPAELMTEFDFSPEPDRLETREVLEKLTKPQLQKLAKSFKVEAPRTLKKAELIETLLSHPGETTKTTTKKTVKQLGSGSQLIHNDPAAKTLALLKLDELAQRYQLLKPGQKPSARSRKAVKECCQAAITAAEGYLDSPAGQRVLKQKGGYIAGLSPTAFWGVSIGGFSLLLTVLALVIYLSRRGSKPAESPYQAIPAPPPDTSLLPKAGIYSDPALPVPQYGQYPTSPHYGLTTLPPATPEAVRGTLEAGLGMITPEMAEIARQRLEGKLPAVRPVGRAVTQVLQSRQLSPEVLARGLARPLPPPPKPPRPQRVVPDPGGIYQSIPR